MTCSELHPLLPDYVLDLLEPEEAARVVEHLQSGCERCQGELDELRAASHLLAEQYFETAALGPTPTAVHDEIVARIEGHVVPDPDKPIASPPTARPSSAAASPPPRRRWTPWLVSYAVAASLAFAVGFYIHREPAGNQQYDILSQQMRQFGVRIPPDHVDVSPLTRVDNQEAQTGIVSWDPRQRLLHLFAFDVDPPPRGSSFYVWTVDQHGQYHAAGAVSPTSDNSLAATFPISPSRSPPLKVVVTHEPEDTLSLPGTSNHPKNSAVMTATMKN